MQFGRSGAGAASGHRWNITGASQESWKHISQIAWPVWNKQSLDSNNRKTLGINIVLESQEHAHAHPAPGLCPLFIPLLHRPSKTPVVPPQADTFPASLPLPASLPQSFILYTINLNTEWIFRKVYQIITSYFMLRSAAAFFYI